MSSTWHSTAMQSERVRLLGLAATRRVLALRHHFNGLGDFVAHRGEIGRANEWILREALGPYLPGVVRVGTGFVHCHDRVTSQQDIVLYVEHEAPLFRVGEAVVVDSHGGACATIEVKTTYQRGHLSGVSATRGIGHSSFRVGLFAYQAEESPDAIVDAVFETAWECAQRDSKRNARSFLPDAIMVDRKVVLVCREAGDTWRRPYRRLDLSDTHVGLGFLMFVAALLGDGVPRRPDDIAHMEHDGVVELAWPDEMLRQLPQP